MESLANPVIPIILEELSFHLAHSQVILPSSKLKRKVKRRKCNQMNDTAILEQSEQDTVSEVESVCLAAVSALTATVRHCGSFLSSDTRNQIDCLVLRVLAQHSNSNPCYWNPSFSDSEFRAQLYSLLLASLASPIDLQPPVLCYASTLFEHGCRDRATKVRDICLHGLALVESYIHRPKCIQLVDT